MNAAPGQNAPASRGPVTLPDLQAKTRRGERIVMVTAYDFPTAKVAEETGIDLVLAGDTAATTVLGYPSTVPVSMEEMLMITRSARRGLRTPLLVGDLPFGSYERSHAQAITSAQRMVKEGGADLVKFEGPNAARARAIVAAGIPVMGHLGLTPQTAIALGGGFKTQARTAAAAAKLYRDAVALQDAGCSALVLEAVPRQVAAVVTQSLEIPTIGIGAGPDCHGQVLVLNDLLGIFDEFKPRFVKRFAELRREMVAAVATYAEEVRSGQFPADEHCYTIETREFDDFVSRIHAGASDEQPPR